MEKPRLDVQESSENYQLNFFPEIEQLISQQKSIICKLQKYIIFDEEDLDKMPSTDMTTPTVRLWQEVSSLKALVEAKQIEQKIREINMNLEAAERDRMVADEVIANA